MLTSPLPTYFTLAQTPLQRLAPSPPAAPVPKMLSLLPTYFTPGQSHLQGCLRRQPLQRLRCCSPLIARGFPR
eukprot:12885355-Prorocentrum_lima.AAC.1